MKCNICIPKTVLIYLLISLLLIACDTSQANWDARSTQIAAIIFATQTAEASAPTQKPSPMPTLKMTSTATSTLIPTPTATLTSIPTRTPKPSQVLWRGDLRIHTICSDGFFSYEEIVQKALEMQMDFIAITDHVYYTDTEIPNECAVEVIKECQEENRLLCIPGVEISAGTRHRGPLIALGVQRPLNLDSIIMEKFEPVVQEIHRLGGYAIAAYPYAWYTEDDLSLSGFDAMDCAKGTNEEKQRQLELSVSCHIPCVYLSGTHSLVELGKTYTECTVPINSLTNLKAALTDNKCSNK